MRTDDLIHALAADAGMRSEPIARRFVMLAVLAVLAGAAVYCFTTQPRPDLGATITTLRVAFKFLVTLSLTGLAGALAFRAMRPEDRPMLGRVLAPVLVLLAAGVAGELLAAPPAAWGPLLVGSNALSCLLLVPLLSLAPLGVMLASLRHGAPSQPGRAGALAGLLAGGIGATFYATHCVDDSPLFVTAWYGLGVAIITALGAVLGRRLLRW